jgi:hypothetical protein
MVLASATPESLSGSTVANGPRVAVLLDHTGRVSRVEAAMHERDSRTDPGPFCLRCAEQNDGRTAFETTVIQSERDAVATASVRAARGMVVWLSAHDDADHQSCTEIGMFSGAGFLPVRADAVPTIRRCAVR